MGNTQIKSTTTTLNANENSTNHRLHHHLNHHHSHQEDQNQQPQQKKHHQQQEQHHQLNKKHSKHQDDLQKLSSNEDKANRKQYNSKTWTGDRSNWRSLSSSRSFINYAHPRNKSTSSSAAEKRKSIPNFATLSKTYWPIPYIESTFLPQFNIASKQFVNKYQIESLIEKGAFGVVYKVHNKDDDKDYALKVLSKSQVIGSNSLEAVKTEVDIQSVCGHHPFIVKLITFWQTRKQICILTEFISGGELFNRYTHFTRALVQLYVAEIALALDFLNNAGIIYRDLKPENILLDNERHIKLIDFGLSKWLKIGQRTKSFCGTLQYMAPEILTGETYGHAVDWWALGVVACRMLTDQFPIIQRKSMKDETENENKQLQQESENNKCSVPQFIYSELENCRGFPLKLDQLECQLPPDTKHRKLDKPSIDLLNRLLDVDPQNRLKSLIGLKRIAMYQGYDFEMVKSKKISPMSINGTITK